MRMGERVMAIRRRRWRWRCGVAFLRVLMVRRCGGRDISEVFSGENGILREKTSGSLEIC